MLLALSYTAALLGLFWFMNKVADDHGIRSSISSNAFEPAFRLRNESSRLSGLSHNEDTSAGNLAPAGRNQPIEKLRRLVGVDVSWKAPALSLAGGSPVLRQLFEGIGTVVLRR